MKKIMFIALVGLLAVTGCKKDYTCTCNIDGTDIPTTFTNVTKSDAKKACDAADRDAKDEDPSWGCSLD